MRTLVIAEAGVNHNGDIGMAKALVAAAATAGADLVKFQSFVTAKSIGRNAPKAPYQIDVTGAAETQFDMVRKLELSRSNHEELVAECRSRGIGFFSTAFPSTRAFTRAFAAAVSSFSTAPTMRAAKPLA